MNDKLPPAEHHKIDMSLTYYLSGPMSGIKDYNYPNFELAAGRLRDLGLTVLSPHENRWPANYEDMTPRELWDAMMSLCRSQMYQCQGIILLNGWPHSQGSKVELNFILQRGVLERRHVPVWYFDMTNWILTSMSGARG